MRGELSSVVVMVMVVVVTVVMIVVVGVVVVSWRGPGRRSRRGDPVWSARESWLSV